LRGFIDHEVERETGTDFSGDFWLFSDVFGFLLWGQIAGYAL